MGAEQEKPEESTNVINFEYTTQFNSKSDSDDDFSDNDYWGEFNPSRPVPPTVPPTAPPSEPPSEPPPVPTKSTNKR